MNHLFSPWRMNYVTSEKNKSGCIFCSAQDNDDESGALVAFRGEHAYVIVNRFPYTSGHIMIVPNAHSSNLQSLDPATRAELMELTAKGTEILQTLYHPQGFNIGINLGEAAGAGIEPHLHIHIVPRWFGDTNFMTAVGATRVLPEALEETTVRIRDAWNARGTM